MLSPLRTGTPSGTTAPACHMCSGPQGGAPAPRTQTTVRQNAPGATTSKPGVLGPAPPVLLLLTTQYPSFREPIWAETLQDAGLGPLPSPHPELRGGLGRQAQLPKRGWDPALRTTPVQSSAPAGTHSRPQGRTKPATPSPLRPRTASRPASPAGRCTLRPRTQPQPAPRVAGRGAATGPTPPRSRAPGSLAENFPPQLPRPPTHLGRRGGGGGGASPRPGRAGTSQAPPQQPGAAGGDALKGTAAPPPDAVFFRRAVASAPLGPVQVALGPARPPPLRGTKGRGALQPGPARLPPAGDPGRGTAAPPAGAVRAGEGRRAEGEGSGLANVTDPGPGRPPLPRAAAARVAAWSPQAREGGAGSGKFAGRAPPRPLGR